MIKTKTLFVASLKSFLRNWRSVLLLVVFPLLLIYFLFSATNPQGLQKLPVGVVTLGSNISYATLNSEFSDYLYLKQYFSLSSCMTDLENYKVYGCIDIVSTHPYFFYFYYDPSRLASGDLVPFIRYTCDSFREKQATTSASYLIDQIKNVSDQISFFDSQILEAISQVNLYINKINLTIDELKESQHNLISALNNMSQDLDTFQNTKNTIQSQESSYYHQLHDLLSHAISFADTISDPNISNTLLPILTSSYSELESFHLSFERNMSTLQSRIDSYRTLEREGFEYANEIDREIIELQQIRSQLIILNANLQYDANKLNELHAKFERMSFLTGKDIVNPVIFKTTSVYPLLGYLNEVSVKEHAALCLPTVSDHKTFSAFLKSSNNIFKGQTFFPIVLILLILFLSILISSFMTLTYINSPARIRVSLIHGTFVPEFISLFLSSFLIVLLPITIVLILGFSIFHLYPILYHVIAVLAIVSFDIAIFVLVGMMSSYIIKKESLTLLTNTFLMVSLIFVSGLILPLERMRPIVSSISRITPAKVALDSFYKLVFYNVPFYPGCRDFNILLAWFLALLFLTLLIKKFSKN